MRLKETKRQAAGLARREYYRGISRAIKSVISRDLSKSPDVTPGSLREGKSRCIDDSAAENPKESRDTHALPNCEDCGEPVSLANWAGRQPAIHRWCSFTRKKLVDEPGEDAGRRPVCPGCRRRFYIYLRSFSKYGCGNVHCPRFLDSADMATGGDEVKETTDIKTAATAPTPNDPTLAYRLAARPPAHLDMNGE